MHERVVFRGNFLAVARGARLELFEVAGDALRGIGAGDAPAEVAAFTVAGHAPWVVGRDPEHRQVWWWSPSSGARTIAHRTGARDHALGGVVEIGGASFVTVSQHGRLRLLRGDGSEAIALVTDRPVAWACHAFVPLAADRVAILGNVPGEPLDMVVVVKAGDLLAGQDAIQRALAAANASPGGPALHDQAVSIVVGPGPGETVVVLRDPELEEEPDDDADPDELPDTWGLRGVYLRDLNTSAIVERAPWDVPFHKLAAIAATARVVAVEVPGGVVVRDRVTGAVEQVAGAALDPSGARLAIPDGRGAWQLRALPR